MRAAWALLAVALAGPPEEAPAGGYWLGVELAELEGPAADRALSALRQGQDPVAPTGEPPPGVVVAYAARVQDAVAFVSRWAFDGPVGFGDDGAALRPVAAPVPGGALWQHGAHLLALVVSGATPDGGLRPIAWPSDPGEVLPPEHPWRPAALVPVAAPLFAMPAANLPPARERTTMIHRRGALYVLGTLDRCGAHQGAEQCLRWVQVVAREGDRFVPGYLPAFQVVLAERWIPDAQSLPRAQVTASTHGSGSARFEVVGRGTDDTLRRASVTLAAPEVGFPTPLVQVESDAAVITVPGQASVRLPIDATLSRRPPRN